MVIYNDICTVYSENNIDNINNLIYVVTQSESKEILHSFIDGNDYELTVEVEKKNILTIYIIFIKLMIYLSLLIINKM